MGDKASPKVDNISPEAVQILQRLGEIRKQILDLVQPLRSQLTYQELCRLRLEGIITNTEFQLLTNPLFDPLARWLNPLAMCDLFDTCHQ